MQVCDACVMVITVAVAAAAAAVAAAIKHTQPVLTAYSGWQCVHRLV
jgi:hypothetical protein